MRRVLLVEADETTRRELLLGLRERAIDADGVADVEAALFALERGEASAVILSAVAVPELSQLVHRLPAAVSSGDAASGGAAVSVGPAASASGAAYGGFAVPGSPAGVARRDTAIIPIIVVVAGDDAEAGLAALRLGAQDFVPAAAGLDGLALVIHKIEARRTFAVGRESGRDRGRGASEEDVRAKFVGESPSIVAVFTKVRRFAAVPSAILVGGESGTGKELIAEALHDLSPWRRGPFVPVNCGAIPAGLIESELFGHARGAFTDAVRDKAGLFEMADGGTLFLDEIADLPLALQAKLLRVLQDGIVRRVGATEDLRVQVRVVAATARDLELEARAGRFREDLYYRLAGLEIQLPPLRSRRDDIPRLAEHFLRRACARLGLTPRWIEPEAMKFLVGYPWPGNVRELENTVERAAVLCGEDRVDVASLPDKVVEASRTTEAPLEWEAISPGGPGENSEEAELSIKRASREMEEALIRRALVRTGGNRVKASELLELSHRALLYKIKDYGIEVAPGRRTGGSKGPGDPKSDSPEG